MAPDILISISLTAELITTYTVVLGILANLSMTAVMILTSGTSSYAWQL